VTGEVDPRDLQAALRAAGLDDVRSDRTTRAAYSSDASLYRVLPRAVAFPRAGDEVVAAIDVAHDLGVAVTARGAGTSVAGNAVGPGLVLDLSRHLDRVVDLDPEAGLARVQPGVVLDSLQRSARAHGLRFGPDPSTHSRCTIGGMIGNDACGSRALGYGRTSDNVAGLRLVTGTATPVRVTRGADGRSQVEGFNDGRAALESLVRADLAVLRTELGRFDRQISGYALHHLLPERGFDLARALVGSEGTLGVLTEATVRLVAEPGHRVLVVLGHTDIAEAGDAAADVRAHRPTACEGIDARIVDVVRQRRGAHLVPELPRGAAWLLAELSGDDPSETQARARRLVAEVDALDARIIDSAAEAAALWRIREDGAGLAGRAPSGAPAWAGWEDAAVPPESLGPYLREFEDLVKAHGLTHMPFGHFGDGCVHTRLDFPLDRPDGPAHLRFFLDEAAALVARHGGSLSGEHGDGRARSELLRHLYSPRALRLFAAVKHVFDPAGILNPGVLVDPAPVDGSLRLPVPVGDPVNGAELAFAYDSDDGNLVQALHRCTGVARCRTGSAGAGTVMCPSFAATRDEKDSTRGRARVLQEMVSRSFVQGWRDPAVHDALDLCLSCKGCASDCPTGIDMATYKSEVLHQTYRGRLRPRSHYTLGRLPQWARLASRAPGLANRVMGAAPLRRLLFAAAGIDRRRSAPAFADETFRTWFAARPVPPPRRTPTRPVTLFVDSFTELFAPEIGRAMVQVLEDAGYAVRLTDPDACCGLTWISTGQLDTARRILTRSIGALADPKVPNVPVVGIEPSCTAVLRHDAVDLLGTAAARDVASRVVTLAELLGADPSWSPPDLRETRVVAQPHCHHHAVMGWEADAALLARAGASVEQLGGCCGLAGNFGMEQGHYEVSVAVAEQQLSPALRRAEPGTGLLADGFSCRTQAADLSGWRGVHLAQLLAGAND
jgi:FAD/FMN-containing dehydrogenase/Fe-S oxidoreductase